jgi:protein-tyrosine phosphatase
VRRVENLTAFLELGVRRFIDLTEPGEHPPYAPLLASIAEEHGIGAEHLRFGIPDEGVPTPAAMRAILNTLEGELDEGDFVYVHCRGGAGRTGTVLGCYLIERGFSPDDALAQIAVDRRDTSRASWAAPETVEQRRFVLAWPPSRG